MRILHSKQDVEVTDLEYEENKTRFYEKNQYGLHGILSSFQAERLDDKCTITPVSTMSLHCQPLDPVNPLTATYHNLYAIIIVVMAFVKMESMRAVSTRELYRSESI